MMRQISGVRALEDVAMPRLNSSMGFNLYGKTMSDPTLAPLEVARALLAGVVIHADLFFTGSILYWDLSINT